MKLKMKNHQGSASIADGDIYILENANGVTVKVTDYGAIVMAIKVPDKEGIFENVVLGFENVADYRTENYLTENPYLGAIVGRNANVINNAAFHIDGIQYQLQKNFGKHNLHGGVKGFDKVMWQVDEYDKSSLKLSYSSPDEEEGFPGTLDTRVIYTLTDLNELVIRFLALSNKKTLVNLTSHSYFNLKGEGIGDILDHELVIHADTYVEFDEQLVPTGSIKKVENTPMDFLTASRIGSVIEEEYDQLRYGFGYDVTYVLNDPGYLKPAATLYHQHTGRCMEVLTTLPGIHLYTGNSLTENIKTSYFARAGLCLEAQYFPDAINREGFTAGILNAGAIYDHAIVYRFSVL